MSVMGIFPGKNSIIVNYEVLAEDEFDSSNPDDKYRLIVMMMCECAEALIIEFGRHGLPMFSVRKYMKPEHLHVTRVVNGNSSHISVEIDTASISKEYKDSVLSDRTDINVRKFGGGVLVKASICIEELKSSIDSFDAKMPSVSARRFLYDKLLQDRKMALILALSGESAKIDSSNNWRVQSFSKAGEFFACEFFISIIKEDKSN